MGDSIQGIENFDLTKEDEKSMEIEETASKENENELEDISAYMFGNESQPNQLERIDELEPFIGMEFGSLNEARDQYNNYARYVGFNIQVQNSHRSPVDQQISLAQFVCSKEGFRRNDHDVKKIQRAITRVGCLAKMRVNRDKVTSKYCVTQFEQEHNHKLVTKVHCLRSQRSVSSCAKQLVLDTIAVGGTVSQAAAMISKQSGGASNMGCTTKDLRNAVRTEKIKRLKMGDARVATLYLKDQACKNENFFYAIDMDDEDHLRSVLWIDARSRLAYEAFGDVVTFDSTHLTNKYRMPFAPFVGVNNHGQSILFGCALIGDETDESFTCVMETWLGAMRGQYLKLIITDQCLAQKTAISKVFPDKCHRFCLWHIHRKVNEHLGSLNRIHNNLINDFENLLYYNGTTEEFEENWESLENYNLRDNNWLKLLYRDRHHWCLVFIKSYFFAGMSTTQRSESINSFFDGYVTSTTTLYEFVE